MAEVNKNQEAMINLSEADKIFAPKDLDNHGILSDYIEYKARIFKAVPENCVLVKKNRFTGEVKISGDAFDIKIPFLQKTIKILDRKKSGLKISNPLFTKSMLLSTVDRTIDYEKITYKTLDGVMADVDIAAVIKITDPKKFVLGGKEQLDQLNIVIKQLLRIYIATKDFDDLAVGECQLREFDRRGRLTEFEDLYGIRVNKVIFKEVRLPERLQKLYNDRVEEKQKRQAQLEKLQAEKDKAEMEAQILSITSQAEAEKIKIVENVKKDIQINKTAELVERLKTQGLSDKEIIDYMISKEGNTISMRGNTNNNNAGEIAMGVMAAQKANGTKERNIQKNETIKMSNSQKLVRFIDSLVVFGEQTEKVLQVRKKLVEDEKSRAVVDQLTEEEYNQWLQIIKIDAGLSIGSEESLTHRGSRR